MNFMDRALAGEDVDIDDYIGEWHDTNTDLLLWDYLGMTREEYFAYATCPSQLTSIIVSRLGKRLRK